MCSAFCCSYTSHCLILLAFVLQAMVRQCMSYIPDTPAKVGD